MYIDEQTELDLRLFRIWRKASEAVLANVEKDVTDRGIEPLHFMILELLYNKGPQTIQKISEITSIPNGSITYVVNKLEKKQLAQRQQNMTDKRSSIVVLMDEGKRLFDHIFPEHAALISRNLSFISNEDKNQLIDLLRRIGLGAKALE